MNMEQKNTEQLIAEAEAERGFTLHPAWQDTLMVLLDVHDVKWPAINRILDTLGMFEREAGRLPAKRLDLSA